MTNISILLIFTEYPSLATIPCTILRNLRVARVLWRQRALGQVVKESWLK